jgi:hypothetical protein
MELAHRTAWLSGPLTTMSARWMHHSEPDTPAGRAAIAGQKFTVCILESPGDGAP